MRATSLVSLRTLLVCLSLSACAGGDSGGTGPGSSSQAALVDFATPTMSIGGATLSQSVSVVVRDATGATIPGASVVWTSDNALVATVSGSSATATITAQGPGVAIIKANAGTASSQIEVRVLNAKSVTPTKAAISLREGDSQTVTASVDAEAGAVRTVSWASDNPAVATVSSAGVVTGVSVGSATLRASATANPAISGTTLVTVTAGRTVVLAPTTVQLWVGDGAAISASPEVDSAQSRDVVFSSDNPTVAVVTANGYLTALSVGSTTIHAVSSADPRIKGSAQVQVFPARVVSVTPYAPMLSIGETQTLQASVAIESGMSTAVTWRTSDPAVASVSQSGQVAAVSLGTVTITAVSVADTMRKGTAVVTVYPVVRDLSVSPEAVAIFPVQQINVDANVSAEGSLSRAVSWRSANPTIAAVSASGTITGVSSGQTVVTAISLADTTRRANVAVTVLPPPAIAVFPLAAKIAIGDLKPLTVTLNVDPGLSTAVTWRSSNSTVASVSQSGVVIGVSHGNATITAVSVADTGRKASSSITVAPAVRSISLTSTSSNLFLGASATFAASVVADPGVSTQVLWRSSNPGVATVSASGVVTAIAAGTVSISALAAADTTKSASAPLASVSRPVTVTITQTNLTLGLGQSSSLSAVVTGNPGISTGVNWTSSNPSVATVNSSGVVTAVGQGTTLVSATAQADASKHATLAVVVASRLASNWTASRLSGDLYEDVVSISGVGAIGAFSVNSVGDIFRWNGSAWLVSARGSSFSTRFTAVHALSSSDAIAVGTNGLVVRFNGSSWSAMASGTTRNLQSVYMESSTSAFASGANGTVIQLSGASWTAMTTGSVQSLNGIWSNNGNAIAVGSGGEVLRFTGGSWSRQTVNVGATLYGVAGTSINNVVVVGGNGTVLRFDGTAWSRVLVNNSSNSFYGVGGTGANGGTMYIASDSGMMQLNGTSLTSVNTPYRPRMSSASVDATGALWAGGQRGVVIRGSAGSFTTNNIAPDLNDVWSTSDSNAWAVGEFGFIYRYNGGTWTRQTSPTSATLYTVWAAGANDAFAAGEAGTMLHWNGSTWTSMTLPSSATVYSLWGSSGTNVYAATAEGLVFRYDGSSWSTVLTGSTALWSVFGTSATDVFVAGSDGRVMRLVGNVWSNMSPSSSGTISGIWGASTSSLFAVGFDGSGTNSIGYRNDGNSWQSQSLPSSRILTSVWGPTSTDVYATGEIGTLLRFNGSAWQSMESGTSELLWSVTGSPTGAGGAFAVGFNSTLVTGSSSGASFAGLSSSRAVGRVAGSLEPSSQAMRSSRGRGAVADGLARYRGRRNGARR